MREIAYAIRLRLDAAEDTVNKALISGVITTDGSQRLADTFTGKSEQSIDKFGQIGAPGLLYMYLLYMYEAVAGVRSAAQIGRRSVALRLDLLDAGMISRGGGNEKCLGEGDKALLRKLRMQMAAARKCLPWETRTRK